jgi:hypothetical protein
MSGSARYTAGRAMQQFRRQQHEQDHRRALLKGSAQEHQQGNRQT